jgi:ribosome-binding protein aMBF1 (putative translation factor)
MLHLVTNNYHNLRWWQFATTLAWNASVQTVAEMFGSRLWRVRKERGLSQERLAESTGLSTNFIGEMERGLKAPGLVVIVRLSRALGVSVQDLLIDFSDANVRRLRV